MNLYFLVLLVCFLCQVQEGITIRAQPGRKLHGNIINSGRSHQKSGGTNVFKENITLDVVRDGMPNKHRMLNRQHIQEPTVNGNILASAVYISETADMLYMEELLSDGNVVSCALVYENDTMEYINDKGDVLEFPVDPDAVPYSLPSPVAYNTGNTGGNASVPLRILRSRRAIADDLTSSAVIKLVLFADAAVVDKFKPFNNNDETATRTDIRRFLTLVINEMTIMYQTLRQHSDVYYRGDGVPRPQNFAVQLVDVVFPPPGGNFGFSSSHLESDGRIRASPNAALNSFSSYIATYASAVPYDHAAWITGYDLYDLGIGNILGIAWTGTLCGTGNFNGGFHSSINKITGTISRTLAHELGHGFAMNHDIDIGCPENTYIMGRAIFTPTSATQSTFSKFSSCSAAEIRAYTLAITAGQFRPTCLLPPDQAFFVDFCKGFRGMVLSLDDQCKRAYGATSVRFSTGGTRETFLQNNYVTQCVADAGSDPFYCTVPGGVPGSYTIIPEVLMGTKCVIAGQMNPNNVCFHGVCTSISLCDASPTAAPPLPTAAPPPATPAPRPTACPCSTTYCCRYLYRATRTCCPQCKIVRTFSGLDCRLR